MILFRSYGRDACLISLWDLGSRTSAGNLCHFWLRWPGDLARGILWAGGDRCMTGCLECPLARPVLAQSWSQTATDRAWYSTMALLSGRDRPLRLCVLRPRGSEPKTRRTGVWRPLPQASASSWRALASEVRPLSVTNRCRAHKNANARPRIRTFSVPYVVHGQRSVGGAPT